MKDLSHIIRKSIAGEQVAQRALYEQYRTRWYMLALRYANDKPQAEDIFQEGLIQIYKDLHQYDRKRSKFSTWSSRVLVHAATRYLKKHNWMNSFQELDSGISASSEDENILQHLAGEDLTRLVQELPLGYRLVFNMYAIEGYSHKEIAAELGISVGTSKSQLSRARNELRKQLEVQLKITRYE